MCTKIEEFDDISRRNNQANLSSSYLLTTFSTNGQRTVKANPQPQNLIAKVRKCKKFHTTFYKKFHDKYKNKRPNTSLMQYKVVQTNGKHRKVVSEFSQKVLFLANRKTCKKKSIPLNCNPTRSLAANYIGESIIKQYIWHEFTRD